MSFNELQIGMGTPPEFVGEAVAGESAQTLALVNQLVGGISTNTFDLAEALYKVKKNKFYHPTYETFGAYAKTLAIKLTKAYYLVKMVEVMEFSQVTQIGRASCRQRV